MYRMHLCSLLINKFFLIHKITLIPLNFYNFIQFLINKSSAQTDMMQFLDRLSVTNLVTGKKASWIGLLGTLIVVGLCVAIYLPAVESYFKGNYYQSQYSTYKNQTGFIYSKDDIKMAIVIRNKLTGTVYNHSQLLRILNFEIQGWTPADMNYQSLVTCDNNYFVGDINGVYLQDCLMIPNSILMDVAYNGKLWSELRISIKTPNIIVPFPQKTKPKTLAQASYQSLNNNSYIEFYFTSKVVTPANQVKFQVHKIYTSQFAFTPTNLWASVNVIQGHRLTMIDDSIMPWRNNRNITTLNWDGEQQYVVTNYNWYGVMFDDSLEVAVRYYKKLDWLLGIIGGGMFFVFIIFWRLFNPINRWLQRIQLPTKLFLRKTTIQSAKSELDLAPLKISAFFLLRNLWPFCKDKKTQKVISASENQNDIVLILKKLKVATRNLYKKELITQFRTKFIAFPGDDVNALNRHFRDNFGDQLSSIQQSQDSSNQSSKASKSKEGIKSNIIVIQSNKNQEQSFEQLKQIAQIPILDTPAQQNIFSTQRKQLLKQQIEEIKQKKQKLKRQENNSQSYSGEHQIDAFEFVDDGQFKQQIKKNQQEPKPLKSQPKKLHLLEIKDNSELHIENHEVLPSIQFHQHLAPIVVNSNEGQFIIIPPPQQSPLLNIPLTEPNNIVIQNAEILPPPTNHQEPLIQPVLEERNNEEPVLEERNNEQQPVKQQQQINFDKDKEVDEKFSLNNEQLLVLRQNKELQQILETNPTYWTLKQNKPNILEEILELNNYDKYEGHFEVKKQECRSLIASKIASFFKWMDIFWVRVNFMDKESGSSCGICLTAVIIAISVITFSLTVANMNTFQYLIDKQYVQPRDIYFSGNTSDSLNILVCVSNNSLFTGSSQVLSLNYFVNNSGKVTQVTPAQMQITDNTFNSYGNYFWNAFLNDRCFKMPINVPITLNSTSYVGYTITPYCPGTSAACLAARNTFVNATASTFITTYLPSNTIDFNQTSLLSAISDKQSTTFNNIAFTINTVIEETIFAEIVQLRDNSGNQFMGPPSSVKQSNINVATQTAKQFIKASNASAPLYSFSLKPSQTKTVYTLSQRKLSFILGIIGGVFVFWYAIIGSIGFFYSRFHFHMFIAKQMYQQQGYDGFVLSKFAAALRIPRFLLPGCCQIKEDIERMKGINTKIDKSLNHVSLIKYVDNVYRLSSSFFDNFLLKQLSLLHFKQKIDQASRIAEIVKVNQNEQPQFMSVVDEIQDEDKDKSALLGQIANQTKISFENLQQTYNKEIEKAGKQEAPIQIQRYNQNIIEDPEPCSSSIPNFFDIFQEPASFTFKQSRKIDSCFGGLLTLIVIGLVLIVVIRPLLLYFTTAGRTVSYQTAIDELMPNNNGITLVTGSNFKLGISALNVTNLMPSNISAYINSSVGISILLITTNKTNGNLTTDQTKIDLVPCPAAYLTSWLSPLAIPPTDNFQYAYCVPDGVSLQVSGLATDQIHKYFKLSIYDKSNQTLPANSTTNITSGYKNMSYLLGNFTFQVHYSSPEHNYVDQSMKYFVWSTIFDLPGKTRLVTALERNITLAKVNISYDGDSNQWQKDPLTQIGYIYDDFVTQRMDYKYYQIDQKSLWYNISISFSKRILSYNVTTPKFYEVWGLVGGVIAFFFFIANCLGTSFNNYKMRYLIGRQLYNFDKLKDNSLKMKKKKTDKYVFREINNYGEGKILMAYFLSGLGRLLNDYNFNDTLRRITLIQNKVTKDLDLLEFYKNLYIARESINKQLQRKHHIFRRIKPTDLYLKHIFNPSALEYNFADLKALLNYAKQHNLSSFQQMVIFRVKQKRINIREVFDGNFLARTFGLQDDNRSAHLHNLQATVGSFNSTSGVSRGEQSVQYD